MTESFETLSELLEQKAAKFKNNDLFGTKRPDESWSWVSYGDFHAEVARCRAGLAKKGIDFGDRVAIVADNSIAWATAAFACYGLGAIFVPMYPAQPKNEWEFILADSGAKLVIAGSAEAYDYLRPVLDKTVSLEHLVGIHLPDDDPASFASLLAAGDAGPVPLAELQGSDVAGFIYTSGTTGDPKGVVLTHKNFCTNVIASGSRFEFSDEDRALCFLPWAHSYGQTAELYTFISFGAAMAINDEVPKLVDNLAVVKPSVLVAVPRIFNRIYDRVNKQMDDRPRAIRALFYSAIENDSRLKAGQSVSLLGRVGLGLADKLIFSKIRQRFGGRLRFVVSGSAALSPEVAHFIDALGIDVFEGYGLTETSPVACTNYPGHRKIGSVGQALPGVELRIDTAVTGEEKNGEILIRGPNVMRGYYNQPEASAQVLTEDGWFRSGDLGYLDDEGYLFITGRIKEQYKLENGKYVDPAPLEEQLKLSRYIANVMLYGANKHHNVALVVLDMDNVREYVAERSLEAHAPESLPEVKQLIRDELAKHGEQFKRYEQPQDCLLISEDFTHENDMLTQSMKVKRRNVLKRYQAALDALY